MTQFRVEPGIDPFGKKFVAHALLCESRIASPKDRKTGLFPKGNDIGRVKTFHWKTMDIVKR